MYGKLSERCWEKMDKSEYSSGLSAAAGKLLIGERYISLLAESLAALGFEAIAVPGNQNVDERLSSHCDLSLFYPGGDIIFCADYISGSSFSDKLSQIGLNIEYIDEKQGELYPKDALLNICTVGGRYIFNPKVSSAKAVTFLNGQGREPVPVRQGYARCSSCVVSDNAIITADSGIARACMNKGMDVLKINPGYIVLEGFEYGFIGGASFKISDDILCFTGQLESHPDKADILSFVDSHSVKPVFLTDYPIFDIGGVILL